MFGHDRVGEKLAARGPRYAVSATIRPGEFRVDYVVSGELAEQCRAELEESGHYNVRVHLPEGGLDLREYGRRLGAARLALDEQMFIARAAALRALEEGQAEAAVARELRVDRMTVRKWAGK